MAWGRRCEIGCESWPDEEVYRRCPICSEETSRYKNLSPLDADEAQSILLHIEFDRYYARRCARLGIPVDGPLPEKAARQLNPPRKPPGGGLVQKATST